MKIYVDLLFIINFFLDSLILVGIKKIEKRNTPNIKIFLGATIGALSTILLFYNLNEFYLFTIKIIISIIISLISFGRKDFLRTITYFYLLSIILGGSLYLIDITFNDYIKIKNNYFLNFIIMIIISPIIIFIYIKNFLKNKNKMENIYNIQITINGKTLELVSILDTGNTLIDPYKKRPIILIDKNINIQNKKIIYVPYKALNTNGVIPCIIPDKVKIGEKEFNNCLIGFSKDKFSLNGADCILPNKFKEELC